MLLSRKYLLGHFLIVIIAVSCFLLSSWQFSRLSDRKELNSRVESRMSMKSAELEKVFQPGDSLDVESDEYRQVSVAGTYYESGQVLISGRSREDGAGYNVLTPFELDALDKAVVYVNRGWIPQSLGDALLDGSAGPEAIAPKQGYETQREVVGLLRRNESKRLYGDTKQIEKTKRVSTRISTTLFVDVSGVGNEKLLYQAWIQQKYEIIDGVKNENQSDSVTRFPSVLPQPKLTELNHFAYAMQWIGFGCTALITWFIVCKKQIGKVKKRDA